jgi:peptidyl carrier protein
VDKDTRTTKIKQHIVNSYLSGDSSGLDNDTPLLNLNIINSASIFDLVQFLSEEESVSIPIDQITPNNFQTINSMVKLVENLRPRS